jgi:hypothetical protein
MSVAMGPIMGAALQYSPLDEGDCAIGLIANSQYITIATGVSAWGNLGSEPDLLQGTVGKQPTFNATGINGKGGVFGDGVNDQLDLSPYYLVGNAVTVIMGVKLGTLAGDFTWDVQPGERLFSLTGGGVMQVGHFGDVGQAILNTDGVAPSDLMTGELRCITQLVDATEPTASEVKCRIDGLLDPNASTGSNNATLWPTADTIFSLFGWSGAPSFFGDLGFRQLWLFEKLLSAAAVARVEGYVMRDLGI